jgi:chromosome segregation ATPase
LLVKRQELEQFKKNWQGELSQLQQMMLMLEKELKELVSEQSTYEKRIGMVENVQGNLVRSYENVQNSTSDLEKTAAIWLPKYEAAAQIVNELSSKVERMDEKIQLTCDGESLVQQIARVAESKVDGIKDMMISSHLKDIGVEVKELLERVNTKDLTNCHVRNLFLYFKIYLHIIKIWEFGLHFNISLIYL